MSRAAIVPGHSANRIRAYMPSNYDVFDYDHDPGSSNCDDRGVLIVGHDDAGWTLEDYVLPRLASGMYFGRILGEFSMEDYSEYNLNDPTDAAILVGELYSWKLS